MFGGFGVFWGLGVLGAMRCFRVWARVGGFGVFGDIGVFWDNFRVFRGLGCFGVFWVFGYLGVLSV